MTRISFYYDVVSPWSLLAYHGEPSTMAPIELASAETTLPRRPVLKRYREPWGMKLELKPTFLGGVMHASGNQPPLNVKNKGKWMNESDLPLTAEWMHVSGSPYKFPSTFPVNTMHCMRFLRAIEHKAPEKLEQATDLFLQLIWNPSEGRSADDATKPESLAQAVRSSSLFSEREVDTLLAYANSAENKDRLKQDATTLVEEGGAFGFPWMVVEREDGLKRSFFGSDRFEVMAFWLGKEWSGPLAQSGRARL
ncbi:SPOSA6832_00095, partial [Sporobolomyces salmonicolor]